MSDDASQAALPQVTLLHTLEMLPLKNVFLGEPDLELDFGLLLGFLLLFISVLETRATLLCFSEPPCACKCS